jgi:hypothetical protein
VQANTEPKLEIDHLVYLPSFAQYLLDNKLGELSSLQLEISRENNLPMIKYLEKLPPEQLMEVVVESIRDMLAHLASGKTSEFIARSVDQYSQNQLIGISHDEIEAKDITLVIYARRKGFLYFLPDFTSNTELLIATIKEIDLFLLQLETASFGAHIDLLKKAGILLKR